MNFYIINIFINFNLLKFKLIKYLKSVYNNIKINIKNYYINNVL